MPEGRKELRDKFMTIDAFGNRDDGISTCEGILREAGATFIRGGIISGLDRPLTDDVADALEYLVTEWDYCED